MKVGLNFAHDFRHSLLRTVNSCVKTMLCVKTIQTVKINDITGRLTPLFMTLRYFIEIN